MVDSLLAQIDGGEVALTGEGGLLPGLIKLALERGLAAELTGHLGYEKGDPVGRLLPNARNGSSAKTVQTEAGPVPLEVPQDRDGSFTPRLVPKGQRRIGGLGDMIISLYAGGMTLRDIQFHLASTIGTEVSRDDLKIVDEISEEVLAWQHRPLEPLYPVIYLDALIVKVKDGGHTRNKAAHIAVGVDMAGIKACSGYLGPAERRRLVLGLGVRRSGQPGHPRRAGGVLRRADRLPRGDRGHLVTGRRSDLRRAFDPQRDAVCVLRGAQGRGRGDQTGLHRRQRRGRPRRVGRLRRLGVGEEPSVTRVFDRSWEQFIRFGVPPELRRVIYTTNSIESLNYQMRKVIKNRGQFPNDAAAVKLLWLAICNIEDKRAAERAKERAQKRCRTAPDDSWKDRWSPTGRKHSNSSCWSTPTASSHTCKHCWKAQQTKNRQPTYKNLTRWGPSRSSYRPECDSWLPAWLS